MRIDLHIHSTASDGTLSPAEILSLAQQLKLGAISITDHDTVHGSKEALSVGIPPSLKFLTGVEISASAPLSFPCLGSLHILGYAIRVDDTILNQTLDLLQKARANRNPQIIERLNNFGIHLSLKDVINNAGQCQLGRPHIAQFMMKKGFVESIDEAFDRYLGKGKPAYVDKYRVECAKAIQIIKNAGGIPVLAHPCLIRPSLNQPIENLIITLKSMGLKGIEAYYPKHSPDLTKHYTEIANRHGLLITGGTDFHGSIKPEIEMGFGKGDFFVPYSVYKRLINATKRC
ncbi:MAG: PHP domain-containing protein [Desulfobacterales bacterium]|nr:PHP domain-containing protein [Desulfobacterales bacterium]